MSTDIKVTIKQTKPLTVASLSIKGPYSQISEAFNRLYKTIGEKGFRPSGPPRGVYFNAPGMVPDDQLLWELRSPVVGKVSLSEPDEHGFAIKQADAARVAATKHQGPFDTVGETYIALTEWITQNGYEIVGPPEEVYLSNPAKTSPAQLITEVRFPVKRASG
jgi:effector-binding domain-containing protein